jgi:hypothetical protein
MAQSSSSGDAFDRTFERELDAAVGKVGLAHYVRDAVEHLRAAGGEDRLVRVRVESPPAELGTRRQSAHRVGKLRVDVAHVVEGEQPGSGGGGDDVPLFARRFP